MQNLIFAKEKNTRQRFPPVRISPLADATQAKKII